MKTLTLILPLIAAILHLTSSMAKGANAIDHTEQYLCVAEKASGFSYNKGLNHWDNATFHTENKYLVSPGKDGGKAFQITELGKNYPIGSCEGYFNEHGFLFCGIFGGDFKFNQRNGRFIRSYIVGYFNVGPGLYGTVEENSDTPYIEIGKCSLF